MVGGSFANWRPELIEGEMAMRRCDNSKVPAAQNCVAAADTAFARAAAREWNYSAACGELYCKTSSAALAAAFAPQAARA